MRTTHTNPEVAAYEELLGALLLPVGYVHEYRVYCDLPDRFFFCLDFAHLEAKIDIELDGYSHYTGGRLRTSDIKRDAWLREQGWKIVRVPV